MDKSKSNSFRVEKLRSAQKSLKKQNTVDILMIESFGQRVEVGLRLEKEMDTIIADLDSILATPEPQLSGSNRSWSTIGVLKSRLRNDGQSSTPKKELP